MSLADGNPSKRADANPFDDFIDNCCGDTNCPNDCERLSADNPSRKGWPDKCANCGAHWTQIGFDYALGFNCRKCGASDADE